MGNLVQGLLNTGAEGLIIEAQCHISNGLPGIVIVGLGGKAVDEAKERIRGAFANSKLELPRKRIILNLAPADVPKEGSSLDLPIAATILSAAGRIKEAFGEKDILTGELGLDGTIRPVRGIIGCLLNGKKRGIERFFIPLQNLKQAQLIPGITLVPVSNLKELYLMLNGEAKLPIVQTSSTDNLPTLSRIKPTDGPFLSDIVGQEQAKRAIEIAAAGGHNILLSGPPGTGKSMLAKSLISLLPELSREEMIEVTHIHSLSGNDYESLITDRPFRSPHHSASYTAIVGGGHNLRPGEISLSHGGVLFFDEFPEFNRTTIESLRQPLEDRTITVSRIKESATYPADFIFVATANPCPCGFFGTNKPCQCTPYQINHYRHKLSGPIMDRIDLYVTVDQVEYDQLLSPKDHRDSVQNGNVISRIIAARKRQLLRNNSTKLNANMTNSDINSTSKIDNDAKKLLSDAAKRMDISARSYMRLIKVARTIADLDNSEAVETKHIAEALQYRRPNYPGV